jgi:hypothetical protein
MGRSDKACLLCLTAEVPPQYLIPRRPLGPEAQGQDGKHLFLALYNVALFRT